MAHDPPRLLVGCGLAACYSVEMVFVPAPKCRMRTRPDLHGADWRGLSACHVSGRLLSVAPFSAHIWPSQFSVCRSGDIAVCYWTMECQVILAACSLSPLRPPPCAYWPTATLINTSNTAKMPIGQLLVMGGANPPLFQFLLALCQAPPAHWRFFPHACRIAPAGC